MRHKPKQIWLLVAIHLGVAISFPLQVLWLTEGYVGFGDVWSYLSVTNYIVMTMALVNMAMTIRVSRGLLLSLPLTAVAVMANQSWIAKSIPLIDPGYLWWSGAVYVSVLAFGYAPPFWNLLRHPDTRWWASPKRVTVSVPVKLWTSDGYPIFTQTVNLSETGALLSWEDHMWREGAPHVDDTIEMKLKIDSFRQVTVLARVVRVVEQPEFTTKPQVQSFAVRFQSTDNFGVKCLRDLVHGSHCPPSTMAA